MSIFRMQFAGEIKKADHKQVANKSMIEVSLCKKHKGRNGGEDTFTWIRATIWEPADFQIAKLVKGAFIAGSGEFQHRSYEKDGKVGHSCDVRCTSFDIEIGQSAVADPTPSLTPIKPGIGGGMAYSAVDDPPPFMRLSEWG